MACGGQGAGAGELQLPSIGKARMTPVYFFMTTESYGVSLVLTNRPISYDSVILRQEYDRSDEVCRMGPIYRN